MKQFMSIKLILNLALSGAIALSITACSTEEKEQQLRPVRTMTLQASNAISSHTFNGIARSDVAARLSFNVSGRLKSVNVKPGQFVKKGTLVAEVDDAYFKLKVAEVRASLKQTVSELENTALGRICLDKIVHLLPESVRQPLIFVPLGVQLAHLQHKNTQAGG